MLSFSLAAQILYLLALLLLVPIFVLVVNFVFGFVEEVPKEKVRKAAAEKITRNKKMKTIAIAGSYGKTTVKNFIYQLTKFSYKTQMIPGNINTPGGIANWILSELKPDTELLIAEVDTYEIGEIAKSCQVLNPDIAVLTNIGDQHLERFGSKEAHEQALSEVFTYSKPDSIKITTENTKSKFSNLKVESLSESNQTNLKLALEAVSTLNIQPLFIKDTISKLELPDRRQHLGNVLGFDGIDDSYNISFTTAQSGINAAKRLAQKLQRKLLVITAGIPELSKQNHDKNRELGIELERQADFTIILGSIFAQEIAQGFNDKSRMRIIPDFKSFLTSEAQNFKKDDWVLLLQPELNDLYY